LEEIMANKRENKENLYLAFLDIEKAYDKVNRHLMWKLLETIGLSDKIINIIKSLYVDTKAKFTLGDIESGWVYSKRGVRQGCILSPLLFAIYMEEFTQRIKNVGKGVKIGNCVSSTLLFADNVIIMAEIDLGKKWE